MAQVSLSLPTPTFTTTRVTFGTGTENLGSLLDLADSGVTAAFLRQVNLLNSTANLRTIQVSTGPTDTTVPGTNVGPELSSAWEGSAIALTLRAPTLSDLVIIGPASAGLDTTDATEPYTWKLSAAQNTASYTGASFNGIGGWIVEFNALTAAQKGGVTLVLDDNVATHFAYLGTATTGKAYLGATEVTKIYLGSTEIL